MREILDGITRAGGGTFELDYRQNAPATLNDAGAGDVGAAGRSSGRSARRTSSTVPPTMGGEDFAYFANVVPGFYFRLGIVGPGTRSGGLHTPDFRADDAAIAVGMRAMAQLVLEYSNTKS